MPIAWLGNKARPTINGFEATPRALQQSLAGLDRLDNRERSHHILKAARDLNGLDLAPRERVRLLEILRPAARKALDYLGGRIHAQPLPLPPPARAAYEIDLELLDALTQGYETALFHETTDGRRRMVALAAERALALMGERMLLVAQTYMPLEPAFWRRAKAMLRRAEEENADQRLVSDQELRFAPRRRQSPATMFTRMVLFSLAGTQGFRRGEARRLYNALQAWASLVDLRPLEATEPSSQTRFAVDLDSDASPCVLASSSCRPHVRVLEVAELIHQIEQLRIATGPEENPIPADNELGARALSRLVNSWHPANHQRCKRARRGSEVDAEVTLRVIHTRMTLETTPAATQEVARAATDDLTLEPVDEPSGGRFECLDGVRPGVNWTEVPKGHDRSAGYEAAREAETPSARVDVECDAAPRWLLEDISATGFRLIWHGKGYCRAAVGELVALRLSDAGEQKRRWCVGAIRRMRFMDKQRFEIGVEVLSRHPLPARIRSEPGNPNMTRFRDSEPTAPALLLPANRRERRNTTVLVPSHMFHAEEIVEIDVQDRMLRLQLADVREDNGAFTHYVLAPAPERGRHAPTNTDLATLLGAAS